MGSGMAKVGQERRKGQGGRSGVEWRGDGEVNRRDVLRAGL